MEIKTHSEYLDLLKEFKFRYRRMGPNKRKHDDRINEISSALIKYREKDPSLPPSKPLSHE